MQAIRVIVYLALTIAQLFQLPGIRFERRITGFHRACQCEDRLDERRTVELTQVDHEPFRLFLKCRTHVRPILEEFRRLDKEVA